MTEFVVIGDLSLDVVVAQSGPRREGSDVPATIRLGPGGQGANVAVRLARQGASVCLVAGLADDAAGRLLRESLAADRVTLVPATARRTSIVIALLDDAGERTMLSDRQTLDPARAAGEIARAGWVHCSGYALLDDRNGDTLAELLAARPSGTRLSVAGGSVPPVPALVARLRARLATARPDLLVFSADEAASVVDRAGAPADLAGELERVAPAAVVTSGAAGSVAAIGGARVSVPADDLPGPMLDATGTGDAYVAGLLRTIAGSRTWPPAESELRTGMAAGSRLGAMTARVVGAQGRLDGERTPA